MSKLPARCVTVLAGVLLLYGAGELPRWGDPLQPASTHVSPRYIEKTIPETGVHNVVTSVLADYRGYDTMFETCVVFTAGVAVMLLLRRNNGKRT